MPKQSCWGYLLRQFLIAVCVSIPVTVWAPNNISKQELELTLDFHILYFKTKKNGHYAIHSGNRLMTKQESLKVTEFLNEQLKQNGIHFSSTYTEVWDKDNYDLSKETRKLAMLKRVSHYAKPGVITIIIPSAAAMSAAYLGQSLETGPIAVFNGQDGELGIARQLGYVFGFTNICSVANNIMFQACPAAGKVRMTHLTWSYFTQDEVSQVFPRILDLWKWEAQGYYMKRSQRISKKVWAQNTHTSSPTNEADIHP